MGRMAEEFREKTDSGYCPSPQSTIIQDGTLLLATAWLDMGRLAKFVLHGGCKPGDVVLHHQFGEESERSSKLSPLYEASRLGQTETVRVLLKYNGNIYASAEPVVIYVICRVIWRISRCRKGVDDEGQNLIHENRHATALVGAVIGGSWKVAAAILDRDPNPDNPEHCTPHPTLPDRYENRPLEFACLYGFS